MALGFWSRVTVTLAVVLAGPVWATDEAIELPRGPSAARLHSALSLTGDTKISAVAEAIEKGFGAPPAERAPFFAALCRVSVDELYPHRELLLSLSSSYPYPDSVVRLVDSIEWVRVSAEERKAIYRKALDRGQTKWGRASTMDRYSAIEAVCADGLEDLRGPLLRAIDALSPTERVRMDVDSQLEILALCAGPSAPLENASRRVEGLGSKVIHRMREERPYRGAILRLLLFAESDARPESRRYIETLRGAVQDWDAEPGAEKFGVISWEGPVRETLMSEKAPS